MKAIEFATMGLCAFFALVCMGCAMICTKLYTEVAKQEMQRGRGSDGAREGGEENG